MPKKAFSNNEDRPSESGARDECARTVTTTHARKTTTPHARPRPLRGMINLLGTFSKKQLTINEMYL